MLLLQVSPLEPTRHNRIGETTYLLPDPAAKH